MRNTFRFFILVFCFLSANTFSNYSINVPILVYHNLDPVKKGSMTISTQKFETQLKWMKNHGYTIIPLKELAAYLQGKINTLPLKSVVITDDDGKKSVYTYMLPIARHYHAPITLFIYPSIISREPYALTWEQIKELQKTGLFDIESHTVGHPNFRQEKKRLSENVYQKMVHAQLVNSKNILEKQLGTHVTLLAWPFGIHDRYLEQAAAKAGYVMAFSIAHRDANRSEDAMAMPRYMIIESQSFKTFERILK